MTVDLSIFQHYASAEHGVVSQLHQLDTILIGVTGNQSPTNFSGSSGTCKLERKTNGSWLAALPPCSSSHWRSGDLLHNLRPREVLAEPVSRAHPTDLRRGTPWLSWPSTQKDTSAAMQMRCTTWHVRCKSASRRSSTRLLARLCYGALYSNLRARQSCPQRLQLATSRVSRPQHGHCRPRLRPLYPVLVPAHGTATEHSLAATTDYWTYIQ